MMAGTADPLLHGVAAVEGRLRFRTGTMRHCVVALIAMLIAL